MSDEKQRLSDHILEALEMAVSQKDKDISTALARALEMSLTRQAGGAGFEERREYDAKIQSLLEQASDM